MSHFLLVGERLNNHVLGKPRAMVTVKVVEAKKAVALEIVEDSLGVAKQDTEFMPLPDRVKVVGLDGRQVKPSKGSRFWVTSETFDPFHGVVELPSDWHHFRG